MDRYQRSILLTLLFTLSSFALFAQSTDTVSKGRFVVSDILITGNSRTKASVIKRELSFKKGDTIRIADWPTIALRSKQNVMNTGLFNFTTVDTVHISTGQTLVTIDVVEQWYIFPIPIFQVEERNFNTWWVQDHRSLDKADYGMYLSDNNFLGEKQILRLKAQFGYTQQFGASYNIPYINKNQNSGLQFYFNSSTNREIPYTSINNILTYVTTPDNVIKHDYSGTLDYTYRQGLYNIHYAEVDFYSSKVADTILKLTNDYLPGNQTQANFFEVKYYFRRDMRDYSPYPLRGYYIDFSINDYGLGLMKNPFNIIYLQSSFHKYWAISDKFFYSAMVEGKVSGNAQQPYYIQRGLGYSNDFIRGYEYNVIDGNNYTIVKNEIKYQILSVSEQKIPYLKLRQFNKTFLSVYLTAFSDWGYVGDPDPFVTGNTLANTPLWGNGFGIDLATYYGLVWRFEYSFNALGQNGFFLHFQAVM